MKNAAGSNQKVGMIAAEGDARERANLKETEAPNLPHAQAVEEQKVVNQKLGQDKLCAISS